MTGEEMSRKEYDQQRRTMALSRDEYDRVRRGQPDYEALMEKFDSELEPIFHQALEEAQQGKVRFDSYRWDAFLDWIEFRLSKRILFHEMYPEDKRGTANPFYPHFEGFSRMRRFDPNRGGGPMVFSIIATAISRSKAETERFVKFFRVVKEEETSGT